MAQRCWSLSRRIFNSWWRHQVENFPHYWPYVRESTCYLWFPLTNANDVEFWCILRSVSQQTVEQTIEMPVIGDAIALIMTSMYCWIFAARLTEQPLMQNGFLWWRIYRSCCSCCYSRVRSICFENLEISMVQNKFQRISQFVCDLMIFNFQ